MCAVTAAMIGAGKGEGGGAFLAGFLFGPFGILWALLSKGNRRACPSCMKLLHKDALICPHCRTSRSGWTPRAIHKKPLALRPETARSGLTTNEPGIFLYLNGVVQGPFSPTQVEGFLQVGTATLNTKCCIEGSEQWEPLRSLAS